MGATLKTFIPKRYLIFQSMWTKSVPACFMGRYLLLILIHIFTRILLYLFLMLTVYIIKTISLDLVVVTPLKMYCCGSFEAVAKYVFFFNTQAGLKCTLTVTW